MSKLLPFLVAAAGASTVSVGGVFMLKKGGAEKGTDEGKTSSPPTTGNEGDVAGGTHTVSSKSTNQPAIVFPEDLKKFRDEKGDTCSQSLFGGIEFNSHSINPKDFTTDTDGLTNYFGSTPATNGEETTKGCLFIDWKKTTTADSKWRGTFNWSWSFKNNDRGFIIFSSAKTNTSNKKLDLTGLAYLLTKENSGTWKLTHKKEVTKAKEIDDSTFASKFPKAQDSLSTVKGDKEYWGFKDTSTKISDICEQDNCSGTDSNSEDPKKLSWKWATGGDTQKIGEWCEDLNWFDHIYDATGFGLKAKLQDFQGTWTDFPTR